MRTGTDNPPWSASSSSRRQLCSAGHGHTAQTHKTVSVVFECGQTLDGQSDALSSPSPPATLPPVHCASPCRNPRSSTGRFPSTYRCRKASLSSTHSTTSISQLASGGRSVMLSPQPPVSAAGSTAGSAVTGAGCAAC
eukprot:COSAG04_NODE_230_length_19216_cov_15.830787_7_plen_138_part_00